MYVNFLNPISTLLLLSMYMFSLCNTLAQNNEGQTMIKPRKQATLPEGYIFLPCERLTIVKDIVNDQQRIHFEINNPYVREREIHVFLKPGTDDLTDLLSGTYKLFFTITSLALTNQETGKKILFEIGQQSRGPSLHVQHGKIDKLIGAIGIATSFKTCPRQ